MEMKRRNVRLSGLNGTWYTVNRYTDLKGNQYYLWESEQRGDEYGAVRSLK